MESNDNHTIKEIIQEKYFLENMNEYLSNLNGENQKIFSSLNHETRTALVTLKTYSEMILDEKFGPINQTQKEKLQLMKKNIDTLTKFLLNIVKEKQKNS